MWGSFFSYFRHLLTLAEATQRNTEDLREIRKELKELTGLTHLDLTATKVTDTGLKELNGFKELRKLWIYDTKMSKAAVKELQEALPDCNITR